MPGRRPGLALPGMLDAEEAVRAGLWAGPASEHWIEAGRVIHEGEDHR